MITLEVPRIREGQSRITVISNPKPDQIRTTISLLVVQGEVTTSILLSAGRARLLAALLIEQAENCENPAERKGSSVYRCLNLEPAGDVL